MTGTRIDPTPDDLEIHARTVKRLMRWTLAESAARRARGQGPVLASELCNITRRAMLDALEFAA